MLGVKLGVDEELELLVSQLNFQDPVGVIGSACVDGQSELVIGIVCRSDQKVSSFFFFVALDELYHAPMADVANKVLLFANLKISSVSRRSERHHLLCFLPDHLLRFPLLVCVVRDAEPDVSQEELILFVKVLPVDLFFGSHHDDLSLQSLG